MNTTEQKPENEKVEWEYSTDPNESLSIDDAVTIWETHKTKGRRQSILVAQLSKSLGMDQAQSYAEKIVKSVSMHDELVEGLRVALNVFGTGYVPKQEGGAENPSTKAYLNLFALLAKATKK